MPSARSSSAAARSHAASPGPARSPAARRAQARSRVDARPRRVPLRSPVVRVRWERVGRIALLVVLLVVIVLWAQDGLSYLSTHTAASRARAQYVQTARTHRRLAAEQQALRSPAVIIRRARALGMTRTGEQPYVMTGQSSAP